MPAVAEDIRAAGFMPAAQQVTPPYGFVDFCLRNKPDCQGGTDTPEDPALTPARWAELNDVNNYVNKLPQISDNDRYGKTEFWTYADGKGGDCEDFALEKRRMLIDRGWPADALLLTTVREWNGAGHAVLLVETDRGEYVLDNKNWAIVAWKDAPYTWNKRQSRQRPYIWVDLDPHTFKTAQPMNLPPLGAPVPFLAATETASLK
ncbi:MAG: transglutaminase-like cysteine peptidase [Parvibaculum sp.]|uniref:transglutaminase-like cysteine peptidase n=1 Tax=Parvibaculum sp. TaxID=2024848 RepID=UPI0025D459DB|nr:transglutaminase-like cysteine peptidase [Parvibaculum sp.]MCE9648665.1 transglutaminase-like cysteine peptidase [Parvibaculum sp.]